ncbi:hypothetical protein HPB49_006165 [Dermacentor silvarum]|uniref:Uncharacterized protein n=1 Tax=Dermacentor silvarum TaxID=543639 RepID=A0ACB8DBG8_DERSI|nr:hypothetical protein HPB49_006165 [Dermacentor silvarum]
MESRLQEAADVVSDYAKSCGLSSAPQKSELLLASPGKKHASDSPAINIQLEGHTIVPSQSSPTQSPEDDEGDAEGSFRIAFVVIRVRQVFLDRAVDGDFHNLFAKLRVGGAAMFHNFMRVSPQQFDMVRLPSEPNETSNRGSEHATAAIDFLCGASF